MFLIAEEGQNWDFAAVRVPNMPIGSPRQKPTFSGRPAAVVEQPKLGRLRTGSSGPGSRIKLTFVQTDAVGATVKKATFDRVAPLRKIAVSSCRLSIGRHGRNSVLALHENMKSIQASYSAELARGVASSAIEASAPQLR